jgi:hypothetical protein
MSERMKKYRERQLEKGLVQIRLWVKKEDEEFFKFMSKMVNPNKREPQKKERFGRQATPHQIKLAEEIAERLSIKTPKHLYLHHISLCGWIWANMSKHKG